MVNSYIHLANIVGQDNVAAISSIALGFSQLFDLAVLEAEAAYIAEQRGMYGHYLQFFIDCVKNAKGRNKSEIIDAVHNYLHDKTKPTKFLNSFLIKKKYQTTIQADSQQLGFFEKLATGHLQAVEPLSFLDMLRCAHSLSLSLSPSLKIFVYTYQNLQRLKSKLENDKQKFGRVAYIINIEQNDKKTPKWITVYDIPSSGTNQVLDTACFDRAGKHRKIFCPVSLFESEKKILNDVFCGLNKDGVGSGKDIVASGHRVLEVFNITGTHFGETLWYNARCFFKDIPVHLEKTDQTLLSASFQYFLQIIPNNCFADYHLATLIESSELEKVGVQHYDLCALLKVVQEKRITWEELEEYRCQRFRYYIPGLHLLKEFFNTNSHIAQINIPEKLEVELIKKSCGERESGLFRYVARQPTPAHIADYVIPEEDLAVSMLLNLFRTLTTEKELEIKLSENHRLTEEEVGIVIKLVEINPNLTTLTITNNHDQLKNIRKSLISSLARNVWLAENHYRPALIADHWQEAAFYWIKYLHANPNILFSDMQSQCFKENVQKMGKKGLDSLFQCLVLQQSTIKTMLGRHQPVFYAACKQDEAPSYIKCLLDYLKSQAYFPFADFAIQYIENNSLLINLITALNEQSSFNQIILSSFVQDKQIAANFLEQLIQQASKQQWTGLIVIPELLDGELSFCAAYRDLCNQYNELNNVILSCRRSVAVQQSNDHAGSKNSTLLTNQEAEFITPPRQENTAIPAVASSSVLSPLFNSSIVNQTWPLNKSGAYIQIQQQEQQQQQQQQLQQQQEQQQQQQEGQETELDVHLIQSMNIDKNKEISTFYEELKTKEFVDVRRHARLGEEKSELQKWFHTWINVNPNVLEAHHVIHAMVPVAFMQLLKKRHQYAGGIGINQLPKGFYLQRDQYNNLVLCYDAERGYATPKTVFTIDVENNPMPAEQWRDDFRQFSMSGQHNQTQGQTMNARLLDSEDFTPLLVFEYLQPLNRNEEAKQYDSFRRQNPQLDKVVAGCEDKIKQHWLCFLQAWYHCGEDGIKNFLALDEQRLRLTPQQVLQFLLPSSVTHSLIINRYKWTAHNVRAIGQVYNRYGSQGLQILFNAFAALMTDDLGHQFFDEFKKSFIDPSPNCCELLRSSTSLNPILEMATFFLKNTDKIKPWQYLVQQHVQIQGWESLDALWQGFQYFCQFLQANKLNLQITENLRIDNMLVWMNNVLTCLEGLTNQEKQQTFLNQLATLDLTYGGVPYAIKYEKFKRCDAELKLTNFEQGEPTYTPNLNNIYAWNAAQSAVRIPRVLALHENYFPNAYKQLCERLVAADDDYYKSKKNLVLLLTTQYDRTVDGWLDLCWHTVNAIEEKNKSILASHLHQAVYVNSATPSLDLASLTLFKNDKIDLDGSFNYRELLRIYNDGSLLETVNILFYRYKNDLCRVDKVADLFTLFSDFQFKPNQCQIKQALKLAVLFHGLSGHTKTSVQDYIEAIQTIIEVSPSAIDKINVFIKQLLSAELQQSDFSKLDLSDWQAFLGCISASNSTNVTCHRQDFIAHLMHKGLVFKYCVSGQYRLLTQDDYADLSVLNEGSDKKQLWVFLKKHILVPVQGETSLPALVDFFKTLQNRNTSIDEAERLLILLKNKSIGGSYWVASYLTKLFSCLAPPHNDIPYPLLLLEMLLTDPLTKPKTIAESIDADFPERLVRALQAITATQPIYPQWCQILLKIYFEKKDITLFWQMFNTVNRYEHVQEKMLTVLAQSPNTDTLQQQWNRSQWILTFFSASPAAQDDEEKFYQYWVSALHDTRLCKLLDEIRQQYCNNNISAEQILRIVAFSVLRRELQHHNLTPQNLNEASALIKQLKQLNLEELKQLAAFCELEPCPDAHAILSFIEQQDWDQSLKEYEKNPHRQLRADYGLLHATRSSDLERMLRECQLIQGDQTTNISFEQTYQILLAFTYLKKLEAGEEKIKIPATSSSFSVRQLSRRQIAAAYKELSNHPNLLSDLYVRMQLWAVIFEALGRTTEQYPHLAQQFAVITNDICIQHSHRISQLATGEGKSHLIVLRAAYYAGQGKCVDICTVKRTLARRDHNYYQAFFKYLDIRSAYIDTLSKRDDYVGSRIHFATLGYLHLFLVRMSLAHQAISIPPENRVVLLDEFDLTRFWVNKTMRYNFAIPLEQNSKEQRKLWLRFYKIINTFYAENSEKLIQGNCIELTQVTQLKEELLITLIQGNPDASMQGLAAAIYDNSALVEWIQAAHIANHILKPDVDFVLYPEKTSTGEQLKIIPLSHDNQRMMDATFICGVQQLLAVLLNTQFELNEKPPNVEIPIQSSILSSQNAVPCLNLLWGIHEGFTATVSAQQAKVLYAHHGTQILQIPTNRLSLRQWHTPGFYNDPQARLQAIIEQTKLCFANKKSILFACKDDEAIKLLEKELKGRLDEEAFQQFIFYTNDQFKDPNIVLDEKRKREQWQGKIKQQGIALVASGLGRGDNADVDAVFIFDVTDPNDLRQRGGRTARNGAEGDVYEFYLLPELEEIQAQRRQLLPGDQPMKLLGSELSTEVAQLNECAFFSLNKEEQQYYELFSQFCHWGIDLLSQTDSGNKLLLSQWLMGLQQIEAYWANIGTTEDSSEKINCIKIKIYKYAQQLQSNKLFEAFKFSEEKLSEPVAQDRKPEAVILRKLCLHLTHFNISEINQERVDGVLKNIAKIAKDASLLSSLENKIDLIQSFDDLEILLENIQVAASSSNSLFKVHQQLIFLPLKIRGLLLANENDSANIDQYVPLINYLRKLSVQQRKEWGPGFINLMQTSSFFAQHEAQLLAFLNIMPAMSVDHFQRLWKFVQQYKLTNDDDLRTVQQATAVSTQGLLECLTIAEGLAEYLNSEKWKQSFLRHVCQVMSGFRNEDFSIFKSLLQTSGKFWEINDGVYRLSLLTVWEKLSKRVDQLREIGSLINACLKEQNKIGFDYLTSCLDLDDDLITKPVLIALITQVNDFDIYPSGQKIAIVTSYVRLIEDHYEIKKEFITNTLQLLGKIKQADGQLACDQKEINTLLKLSIENQPQLSKINEILEEYNGENRCRLLRCLLEFNSELPNLVDNERNRRREIWDGVKKIILTFIFDYNLPNTLSEQQLMVWLTHLHVMLSNNISEQELLGALHRILKNHQSFFNKIKEIKNKITEHDVLSTLTNYLKFCQNGGYRFGDILNDIFKEPQLLVSFFVNYSGSATLHPALMNSLIKRMKGKNKEQNNTELKVMKGKNKGQNNAELMNHIKEINELLNCTFTNHFKRDIVGCFADIIEKWSVNEIDLLRKLLKEQNIFFKDSSRLHSLLKYLCDNSDMRFFKLEVINNSNLEKCDQYGFNLKSLELLFIFSRMFETSQSISSFLKGNLTVYNQQRVLQFINCLGDCLSSEQIGSLLSILNGAEALDIWLQTKKMVKYLNKAPKGRHGIINAVVNDFFNAVRHNKTNSNEILNKLFNYFDFNSGLNDKQIQQKRVTLMYMLNHRMFNASVPDLSWRWDDNDNQRLLDRCFAKYSEHANTILAAKKEFTLESTHDLSLDQRSQLLGLATELERIGNENPHLTDTPQPKLHQNLIGFLNKYENKAWFISNKRGARLNEVREAITNLNSHHQDVHTPYYLEVLKELNKIKNEAMQDDCHTNGSAYFKQNRSGKSRFLNTLNCMQDAVLRSMANNPRAIQYLSKYRDHIKQDIFSIATYLRTEIEQLNTTINWGGFFSDHGQRFENLMPILNTIAPQHEIDINTLRRLGEQLNNISQDKNMPGHIVTLINQLKEPVGALQQTIDLDSPSILSARI
jgi:hypothetical protein